MGKDQDALGLHEAGTPVLVIKAVDADAAAATTGRVNEPVTADVDTGMADLTTPTVVEKDHVTRLQLAAFDLRCSRLIISRVERGSSMPASLRNRKLTKPLQSKPVFVELPP